MLEDPTLRLHAIQRARQEHHEIGDTHRLVRSLRPAAPPRAARTPRLPRLWRTRLAWRLHLHAT